MTAITIIATSGPAIADVPLAGPHLIRAGWGDSPGGATFDRVSLRHKRLVSRSAPGGRVKTDVARGGRGRIGTTGKPRAKLQVADGACVEGSLRPVTPEPDQPISEMRGGGSGAADLPYAASPARRPQGGRHHTIGRDMQGLAPKEPTEMLPSVIMQKAGAFVPDTKDCAPA